MLYSGRHRLGQSRSDKGVSVSFPPVRSSLLNTSRFALKFQKIVQEEQDANFITRLHAGKLQIVPWPVIESREFYKLFYSVKKKLDQQKSSHRTAGEFLHTLKTLMAKLKVCSTSIHTESPLTNATYMRIGKRLGSYVTYVPVSGGCALLNIRFRNHGRTSRELPPRDFARCSGDRILRGSP
jgi:hypothetical protein